MVGDLTITYKKVPSINLSESGYTNIEEVSQRHANTFSNSNDYKKNITEAVKDFEYFINTECSTSFKTIKEPLKILDIGCGNGIYAHFFKHLIKIRTNYTGCEISDSMVDICKKNSPKSRFFKSFADNINSNDNIYDLVFCSSTLQYTINRWKESLVEMKRVSNKYIALLRLPVSKYNKSCYVEQNINSSGYIEVNYFNLLNREELEKMFDRLKLKIIKRDYSSEEYKIEGVDEKIILVQYLLAKK